MCRLYGFRATHPTEVECELVEAQNSLIRQSEKDERGLVNDQGWGLGLVRDGTVSCEREVGPAAESEEYRRDAASARATTVLAHVRRATVGQPTRENTHPFRDGRSMLIHNGHIGRFDAVRAKMLDEMRPEDRDAIDGTTDSEHFFRLLVSRRARRPDLPLTEILRRAIGDVIEMVHEEDTDVEVALNVIWTVDEEMVGSRLGRDLWMLERDGPRICGVCGEPHPEPDVLGAGERYRAAVLASERITDDEPWEEVPDGSVFRVDDGLRVRVEPIGL